MMGRLLVIGASGLVGHRLALTAAANGYVVRGMARDPDRIADLHAAGCETIRGDMGDPATLRQAMSGVEAVVVSVHTLSPQPSGVGSFMDLERQGVRHILDAAKAEGSGRIVYVTSLGVGPQAPGEWLKGRWQTEQMVLNSGLHSVVVRPGQIVGRGGRGFEMVLANARRRVAVMLGNGRLATRAIALDDLVQDVLGVLEEPRASGRAFDVGGPDVLSVAQMIDHAAAVLGRRPPRKVTLPIAAVRLASPLIEGATHIPRGALAGLLDSLAGDGVGDPTPIWSLLPRSRLGYRAAVERALGAAAG